MIAETKTTRVDIRQGAAHLVLRAPLATMDNMAHVFEAQVYDGDAAADLSGAKCEAYFIRADGVTVMLDGTVSGSTASVTLGANCYAVPGRFELAVKLTQGDTVHTILRAEGSVTTSRTDAMTGTGSGVHSFDQLENRLDGLNIAMQRRDRVWNLLDNSDFRNPVNQRGQTRYTGADYAIDRWRSWVDSNTLTIHDGYITTTGDYAQYIKGLPGGNYSAFAMRADGTLIQLHTGYESANDWRFVSLPAGSYVWAALYPGAYTAETLPAYMPKGYAAELLECQRYYYAIPDNSDIAYIGFCASATLARITIQTPVPMIAKPTLSVGEVSKINLYAEANTGATTAIHCNGYDGNAATLYCTASNLTAWKPCVMRFNTPAALSADL